MIEATYKMFARCDAMLSTRLCWCTMCYCLATAAKYISSASLATFVIKRLPRTLATSQPSGLLMAISRAPGQMAYVTWFLGQSTFHCVTGIVMDSCSCQIERPLRQGFDLTTHNVCRRLDQSQDLRRFRRCAGRSCSGCLKRHVDQGRRCFGDRFGSPGATSR